MNDTPPDADGTKPHLQPDQQDESPAPANRPSRAASHRSDDHEQTEWAKPTWPELAGVLALVVLCDLVIYRGHGYGGIAVLLSIAPCLLAYSSPQRHLSRSGWLIGAMLLAAAAKLLWCGSHLLVGTGFALLVAFSMSLAGVRPFVLETLFFAQQTIPSGFAGLDLYCRSFAKIAPQLPRSSFVNLAFPLLAFVVFGWIFLLANPELFKQFDSRLSEMLSQLSTWLATWSPDVFEIMFWVAAAWIVVGLLRPTATPRLEFAEHREHTAGAGSGEPAFLFASARNTLLTVIALFAVYLVFEVQTLWFREFPKGFYYSGYAHEGAAWLTVALALATVVLSMVFRGTVLADPRQSQLRKLAGIWSFQNFLLALAVYNRLFIYVGFNGMTRMRIVGLYGITAVVIGFALVVWKIARNRRFHWLVRRQLWTLSGIVYLFALTPLDAIVVRYNVARILSGDPAPAVQISVHPINAEGVLLLEPLLNDENETIREGVRALLADHLRQAEQQAEEREGLGWTTYQLGDRRALAGLRELAPRLETFTSSDQQAEALREFHSYSYQWY